MNNTHTRWWPAAWSAVLAAATISGTVVIGCMMPFAAIATIAALPRRAGIGAVGACWLGNQVIGFGLLGYPWNALTFAAGLSLLAAGLLAYAMAGQIGPRLGAGGAIAAFAAAFVTYEATLFAYAATFGDVTMFAPQIVALIALNDGLWFAGLWLGWQMLQLAASAASTRPTA
jgi:hypothetical protein